MADMQKLTNLLENYQIWKLDNLWSELNLSVISNGLKNSMFNSKVKKYASALFADVFENNPSKAISQILYVFPHERSSIINSRLMYLYTRDGNFKETKRIAAKLNNKTSDMYLQIIDEIKKPVSITKSMKHTFENHGIHSHFAHLEKLIRDNNYSLGVEVGVFMGYHSFHLLESVRTLKLWGVDPYKVIPGSGYDDRTNRDFDKLFAHVKSTLYPSGRFQIIRNMSVIAAKSFKKNQLDFVYLDADHRFSGISKDLETWSSKVRKGGIISGHDYGKEWPDVKKAVDQWSSKNDFQPTVLSGTFWYVKKS